MEFSGRFRADKKTYDAVLSEGGYANVAW